MLTKLIILIKQLFGIIDVKPKYRRYYFDGELWHDSKFSIKENGEFKEKEVGSGDDVILIVKGKGIIDAKFAIIRSKYIRSNLSVFTLYLVHNRGEFGCTKYKVLNHPNGEIKFVDPSEGPMILNKINNIEYYFIM